MPRGRCSDRLLAAATYDMGFQTVEYVASALVDLEFHDGAAPADPMQKQAEVLEQIGMPRAIRMRHATPHFAHVFAGDGYSSGYYSYMWSEVMDADAFEAFEEAGDAFDPDLAARLEANILSAGGSDDAAELYTALPRKDAGGRSLAARARAGPGRLGARIGGMARHPDRVLVDQHIGARVAGDDRAPQRRADGMGLVK